MCVHRCMWCVTNVILELISYNDDGGRVDSPSNKIHRYYQ